MATHRLHVFSFHQKHAAEPSAPEPSPTPGASAGAGAGAGPLLPTTVPVSPSSPTSVSSLIFERSVQDPLQPLLLDDASINSVGSHSHSGSHVGSHFAGFSGFSGFSGHYGSSQSIPLHHRNENFIPPVLDASTEILTSSQDLDQVDLVYARRRSSVIGLNMALGSYPCQGQYQSQGGQPQPQAQPQAQPQGQQPDPKHSTSNLRDWYKDTPPTSTSGSTSLSTSPQNHTIKPVLSFYSFADVVNNESCTPGSGAPHRPSMSGLSAIYNNNPPINGIPNGNVNGTTSPYRRRDSNLSIKRVDSFRNLHPTLSSNLDRDRTTSSISSNGYLSRSISPDSTNALNSIAFNMNINGSRSPPHVNNSTQQRKQQVLSPISPFNSNGSTNNNNANNTNANNYEEFNFQPIDYQSSPAQPQFQQSFINDHPKSIRSRASTAFSIFDMPIPEDYDESLTIASVGETLRRHTGEIAIANTNTNINLYKMKSNQKLIINENNNNKNNNVNNIDDLNNQIENGSDSETLPSNSHSHSQISNHPAQSITNSNIEPIAAN